MKNKYSRAKLFTFIQSGMGRESINKQYFELSSGDMLAVNIYNSYFVSIFLIRNDYFKNDILLRQSKIYNISQLIELVNYVDFYISKNIVVKRANTIEESISLQIDFDDMKDVYFG